LDWQLVKLTDQRPPCAAILSCIWWRVGEPLGSLPPSLGRSQRFQVYSADEI